MDCQEEQELELEALESIFAEDYKNISASEFELNIWPVPGEEDENHIGVTMHVTYPADYPTVLPIIKVQRLKGLTDRILAKLEADAMAEAEELLGDVMIYSMTEVIKAFLEENNRPELTAHEEMMNRIKEEEDAIAAAEQQEAERLAVEEKTYVSPLGIQPGVLFTVEGFHAWRAAFEEEQERLKPKKVEVVKKPTGKEIFLANLKMGLEEEVEEKDKEEEVFWYNDGIYDVDDDELDAALEEDDEETEEEEEAPAPAPAKSAPVAKAEAAPKKAAKSATKEKDGAKGGKKVAAGKSAAAAKPAGAANASAESGQKKKKKKKAKKGKAK